MIGEGTFSCMYKGNYQGSEVAIKQLRFRLHTQDRNYFAAEVRLPNKQGVTLLIALFKTKQKSRIL